MEHFVTLFNSLFLPQGLALYTSLEKHLTEFTLWVLCIDDETYEVLVKLNKPNIRLIQLNEVETKELLRVKVERSIGEYCWTLTPFVPRFVFEADPNVKRVTYVDADLWFLKNPAPIFEEFEKSGKQVLITDHSYAPEHDQSANSGRFCVQFLIFSRVGGEVVRKCWEEQCIEWCYNRKEDGKFGDQKYLDEWPNCFSNKVHILEHQEWTLAPWNSTRYPYSCGIFYHFQELKLLNHRKVNLGRYILPPVLIHYVYEPYLACLNDAINQLDSIGFKIQSQQKTPNFINSLNLFVYGIKIQRWRFNIMNILTLDQSNKFRKG